MFFVCAGNHFKLVKTLKMPAFWSSGWSVLDDQKGDLSGVFPAPGTAIWPEYNSDYENFRKYEQVVRRFVGRSKLSVTAS